MRLMGWTGFAVLAGAGALAGAVALPLATSAPSDADSTLRAATVFDEPLVRMPEAGDNCPIPEQPDVDPSYSFYFTRAAYSGSGGRFGGWGGGGRMWRTDFPEAEYFFTQIVGRLIDIDVYTDRGGANPMCLEDPDLRSFPFLYVVEPGGMNLSEPEIRGLRSYLEAGGFMMMDDFWGTYETANVEYQLAQVLPGRPIVDIPLDHPIFNSVYDIEEIRQVPNIRNGMDVAQGYPGARTDEGNNSEVPSVRGIFDDAGRLMVIINQNTDLGDAWEHAENPWYPIDLSTYATQVGINTVVYAFSH